jgi:hypothetical protein
LEATEESTERRFVGVWSDSLLRLSRTTKAKGDYEAIMHEINVILAEVPGLGRVRLCECNSIHVSVGPVTINLEPAAFKQMASLVASATERFRKITELQEEEREAVLM